MGSDNEVLTIPKAARLCSVTRMTMWRWVKSGLIKVSVTPGGHHRIYRRDLERFLIKSGMYPGSDKNLHSNRVLIVDDDALIRKVLSRALRDHHFVTQTAVNGFEAGIKTMQFQPDLIVLDLVMPDMDGFEICRLIKQEPLTAGIKIVVLTGYNAPADREKAVGAGADAYLVKPVEQDVLLQQIKALLGWHKGLKEAGEV